MYCVIVFCLMSCLWTRAESVQIELTPSSVNVCVGASVTIKCTIRDADRNRTRWNIIASSSTVPQVELSLPHSTMIGNFTEAYSPELETNVRVKWMSYSPLCSTLMATATTALGGAKVKCSYNHSVTKSLTITTRDVPIATLYWLNSTSEVLQVDNVTVFVEWESSQVCEIDYLVTITPPVEDGSPSNITTSQTSHGFTIPYNNTYTVTVVGINCAGRSNQLNKTFSFSQGPVCEPPGLTENLIQQTNIETDLLLKDSQIFLSCSLDHSMISTNGTVITCTCSHTSCKWLPDPSQVQCLRDCGDLPLKTDVYTIKERSNNTVEGSIVEFHCVKDAFIRLNDNNSLLLTFCLSNGQWYPNPNDVCTLNERKDVTGNQSVMVYVTVVTVFALLFFFGTFTVLSATVCIVYKIKKTGEFNNISLRHVHSSVDVLTHNVSYELTAVSKKPRIKTEDNPAYVSSSHVASQDVELGMRDQEYETIR